MLDGFKKFILRGNVVDMAVGVVIGAAFRWRGHRTNKSLSYTSDRADRWQAGLFQHQIQHQWHGFPDWRVHQRLHFFCPDCRSCLLLRSSSRECSHRPHASRREATGSDHETMSRVPERNPYPGKALLALHAARDGPRGLAHALTISNIKTPDREVSGVSFLDLDFS